MLICIYLFIYKWCIGKRRKQNKKKEKKVGVYVVGEG